MKMKETIEGERGGEVTNRCAVRAYFGITLLSSSVKKVAPRRKSPVRISTSVNCIAIPTFHSANQSLFDVPMIQVFIYPFISAAESRSPFSYISERWLGLSSLIFDSAPYPSDQVYVHGNLGNVRETQASHIGKAGTLSFILERVTPLMLRNRWSGFQHYPPFPVFVLAAAFVPLLNNLSSKLLAIPIEDTTAKIMKGREESVQSYCRVEHIEEHNMPHLTKKTNGSFRQVVEPRTGINFPAGLVSTESGSGNTSLISQVLVGVGSRSTTIAKVKSIKVYAFGLYVQLDCLCNKLQQKYFNVPPEELKNRPEFFEDLLRQDMWMTVRLVVHLKGLKLGMVQTAFKCALQSRLKRIKGVADDDGLNAFCDYFSKDISLSPGTTIDFHRLPGGHLRTDIDGKELGTIYSRDLCRAFFEIEVQFKITRGAILVLKRHVFHP
ncbi:hypothetical protein SUGI_0191540 [Cryptomeria japonica]|nr:hypothetical protein SUGI_0191540 [Cryptomeria japonica]